MRENESPKWMWATASGCACALIGWAVGSWSHPASEPAAITPVATTHLPALQTASAAPASPEPLILVAHDGNVTLHVEGQPLAWVLEEIQRQGGVVPDALKATAVKVAARADEPVEPPPCAAPLATEAVMSRVLRGTEPERYETLVQAQSGGPGVELSVLKTLYESDASPRVRQLAFEYALQAYEGDPTNLRSALEAARYLPDPVIAQDAAQRLELMASSARTEPDAQQLASHP